MATIDELVQYLDRFLDADAGADYCPNGLQVEGRREVRHVVAGVSASLALIEEAVARSADAVLVHHGIVWNGHAPRIVGSHRRRLRALLANDLNLLAYHLPLDRHPEVGTAATLARGLGLGERQPFGDHKGLPVGCWGVRKPVSLAGFGRQIEQLLGRPPLLLAGGDGSIERVAVATGSSHHDFERAVALGMDAFVTGEPREPAMDLAREEGVHYIAGGHYHTEAPGVRALATHVSERLEVEVTFVDLPNPV